MSLIAIANTLIFCTRIVRGQWEDGHPEEVELRTDRRMHSICFSKCGTCRVLVHIHIIVVVGSNFSVRVAVNKVVWGKMLDSKKNVGDLRESAVR